MAELILSCMGTFDCFVTAGILGMRRNLDLKSCANKMCLTETWVHFKVWIPEVYFVCTYIASIWQTICMSILSSAFFLISHSIGSDASCK